MFADSKEVCAYINNLLLITNRSWENHLEKLDEVLDRLKCADMINYYHNMWQGSSEVLAPLAVLTSKTTPWKWTSVEQKAFK
eukprot:2677727-Ditylum_brightwellii.AAC.1